MIDERLEKKSPLDAVIFVFKGLFDTRSEDDATLCDLGSRDEVLSRNIPQKIVYTGVDIYPTGPKTVYADIARKIPFGDKSFDYVFAVDVLEHTEEISNAVNELRRITKGTYIINLPNELHYLARVRLMFGRTSGKYKIDLSSKDRHRWFFTLDNVERLVRQTDISKDQIRVIAFYRWGRWLRFLNNLLMGLEKDGLGAYSFIIVGSPSD